MTTTQKIIKNLATALAIFLVIIIISGILTGIYAILNASGAINTEETVITEELKTISSELLEVASLQIDLEYTNLYIKTGEKFEIKTNNSEITFENNNDSVKIKEEGKRWFKNKNVESSLIIYIPENMPVLDETNIDIGAGKINIEKLNTKGLYLELGAGEVHIENVIATSETVIDGGAGKTEIQQSKLNNLKADLGIGEFNFSGILTGKSTINSGIGDTNLEIIGKKEDYTISASKGIGNLTLDGQKIEYDRVYSSGNNYLSFDGGIGEINIKFID